MICFEKNMCIKSLTAVFKQSCHITLLFSEWREIIINYIILATVWICTNAICYLSIFYILRSNIWNWSLLFKSRYENKMQWNQNTVQNNQIVKQCVLKKSVLHLYGKSFIRIYRRAMSFTGVTVVLLQNEWYIMRVSLFHFNIKLL